eukprot:SAG11_NODE_3168_length_2638_cov_1.787318_2_plen_73_part_00
MQKMMAGQFTLRDMYEQFQNIMRMGSLSTVMSMIPGMSESLIPKGKEKEGAVRHTAVLKHLQQYLQAPRVCV